MEVFILKKKILLVSNMYPSSKFPSYGVFVKNFSNNLESNEIEYEKIVMYKTNNKFIKVLRYSYFFLKVFFVVLLKKYDIIYIHYPAITAIPILKVTRIKKMNIYTNIHGTDADPVTEKEIRLEKNTKKITELSEKVIVPSVYFKELVLKKYNLHEDKVVVYPSGGIDTTVFKPLNKIYIEDFRKKIIKTTDNKIVIGFASRIEESKGWRYLIEAINLLKDDNAIENFKFIIIGSGKDSTKMQQLIDQYKLNKYIIKKDLVSQEELNSYFNLFDIFLFPTKKESLGLVAIEAMATKTIIIASDIPPLNGYIIPGETGFLVEMGNSIQLSEVIKQVGDLDTEVLEKIKSNAYEISLKYSQKNINKVFEKIFD